MEGVNARGEGRQQAHWQLWGHKPAAVLLHDVVSRRAGGEMQAEEGAGGEGQSGTDLRRVRSHGGRRLRLGGVEGVAAARHCG